MEDPKELKKSATTYIVNPVLPEEENNPKYMLEEAEGLASAINLNIVFSENINVKKPRPDILIGGGQADNIAEFAKANEVELVYVNYSLTAIQQSNLEQRCECKVIDRSGLILEIFADRARTREGKLQVELAALEYQRSRVVRAWSHLERQRGGGGFTGGPGEKQSELDKRMMNDRIKKIKKDLEKVVKTRELHRKKRSKVPYIIVGLVGYTNAGKSTLFNHLTGAKVMAENMLFATLDPTMRTTKLPSGRNIILSDTVGFISKLPTELIAAFRATLEEVVEADILLHIRDISHPETNEQRDNVNITLSSLVDENILNEKCFEVWNKIDLLEEKPNHTPAVSALKGDGVPEFLDWLDDTISSFNDTKTYEVRISDGEAIAWLYANSNVREREDLEEKIKMTVNISSKNASKFEKVYL